MSQNRRSFLINALGFGAVHTVARAADPGVPRLLVVIVAGQFRSDYLDQRNWTFAAGGFRRLFREGAFYPDCRLNSSSFTATSLATLATGTHPCLHGVIAERWYDRATRTTVDARGKALAGTLTPEFRAFDSYLGDKRNRVYSIAFDPGPGELLSGGNADIAFRLDSTGQFQAAGTKPEWLESFRQTYNPELSRNTAWKAISIPGSNPGTGPLKETPPLRVLKYDPAKPADYVALFRSSPLGLAMEFALARELILQENLGRGTGRDLLYVHLDSLASLGQQTGADSPLMGEMVTHVDRQLATLLDLLDSRAGAGHYQLVFAGAHGLANQPQPTRPGAVSALRGREIADLVDTALGKPAVDAYFYPFLYLRPIDPDMRKVRLAAARALVSAGVATSYLTLDGDCSHTGDWRDRMQNSFHPVRSGDVMIGYPPNVFERFGDGSGISYGSLYNYDCEVPVAFLGPGFKAGIYGQTIESIDIAPTIARGAGLALPSSSTGRVLREALSPARFL